MKTINGPALFLAQFAGDEAPFNSWDSITGWAADCGYVGVQVPSWDGRLFDLEKAAASKDYCDEFKGVAAEAETEVLVTRVSADRVTVVPTAPVIISTDMFGLTDELGELRALAQLPSITPAVPVTFSLAFKRG